MNTIAKLLIATCMACSTSAYAKPLSIAPSTPPSDGSKQECLIIGDTTAFELAKALRQRGHACDLVAFKNATARQLDRQVPYRRYSVAYVSLGIADTGNKHLESDLRTMRSHLRAPKVVWVLPYERSVARHVDANAAESGGLVVDLAWWPTHDGLHPSDYGPIADMIVR